jgi:NADP-reducing hydrogenase subunit HndA
MSTTKTVPFKGTKEQEEKLLAIIEKNKNLQGALIPILHEAQEIYGYLPFEVQKNIAEKTGIPMSSIYGVVTFYSQFSLMPKGEYKIAVCLGTACYVKGSGDILDKIKENIGVPVGECGGDGKFSLEATRCIGACGLAPVLTVNEDVYGRVILDDVDGILAKYKG